MATKKKVQFKEGDRVTYIGLKFGHTGQQATITPYPKMFSTQRNRVTGKLIPLSAVTGGVLHITFDDGDTMMVGADRLKILGKKVNMRKKLSEWLKKEKAGS